MASSDRSSIVNVAGTPKRAHPFRAIPEQKLSSVEITALSKSASCSRTKASSVCSRSAR